MPVKSALDRPPAARALD